MKNIILTIFMIPFIIFSQKEESRESKLHRYWAQQERKKAHKSNHRAQSRRNNLADQERSRHDPGCAGAGLQARRAVLPAMGQGIFLLRGLALG